MTPTDARTAVRTRVVSMGLAAAVVFLGLLEAMNNGYLWAEHAVALVVVVLAVATAVGVSIRWPGAALALVWVIFLCQLVTQSPFLVVEASVAVVAFATARWGGPATVALSAVSIPAALVIGVAVVVLGLPLVRLDELDGLYSVVRGFGPQYQLGLGVLGLALLGLPWVLGLALRFSDRARASQVSQRQAELSAEQAEEAAAQSREIARLREEQARLAQDVHDVVGHSLAVILAQAESAQYLEDADPEQLRRTMATIASSARSSLQDVRQVLAPAPTSTTGYGGLDALVQGVRDSGHAISSTEVGTPQPLPPELESVAYRVLQEMLTNAIKHGLRGEPVLVERHWEGELRIEVRNTLDPAAPAPTSPGQGLEGMRRRLESVGGRLDVRRRVAADGGPGATFTATAWMPVRSR